MPISSTKSQMPGDRRSRPSPGESRASDAFIRLAPMSISTSDTSRPGRRQPIKPPEASSSRRAAPVSRSHPKWVILARFGARRDWFRDDRTTSSICYTSRGDQISVSLELVEPPETSVLTLHWPDGPGPIESTLSYPQIFAADGPVVLLRLTLGDNFPRDIIDYFVYKASSDPLQQPSLSRLPTFYSKKNWYAGRPMQHILRSYATGVLSYGEEGFLVADLLTRKDSPRQVDMYMFRSGSKEWIEFKRLPVHCNIERIDSYSLMGWSPNAVLPFCNQSLIWADYRNGLVFARMGNMTRLEKPRLEYVPLPEEDLVRGISNGWTYGKGFPEASRSLGVTCYGIKFVTVDYKHSCSFEGRSTFRITLWSLNSCLEWSRDATMDAEELWALDSENRFPHVPPEFPAINVENPDSICFLLKHSCYILNPSQQAFMIEIDMKKKALLAVTSYSGDMTLSVENTMEYARLASQHSSSISSKIPSYLHLYEEGPSKKKRKST